MDQGNSYYNYMKQIPNWKQLLQLYETNSQLEIPGLLKDVSPA